MDRKPFANLSEIIAWNYTDRRRPRHTINSSYKPRPCVHYSDHFGSSEKFAHSMMGIVHRSCTLPSLKDAVGYALVGIHQFEFDVCQSCALALCPMLLQLISKYEVDSSSPRRVLANTVVCKIFAAILHYPLAAKYLLSKEECTVFHLNAVYVLYQDTCIAYKCPELNKLELQMYVSCYEFCRALTLNSHLLFASRSVDTASFVKFTHNLMDVVLYSLQQEIKDEVYHYISLLDVWTLLMLCVDYLKTKTNWSNGRSRKSSRKSGCKNGTVA